MFGLFKKKRLPADPPTEKQRKYAKRLGIEVLPSMSKVDLSAAISEVERRNPSLAQKRERVKARVHETKFGKELTAQESQWNQFADDVGYMLTVYTKGKEKIVDVLRVNGALITGRGQLKLEVDAPKLVKDRYVGDCLDWDNHFTLPVKSILFHESLHSDFHEDGSEVYQKIIKKGLKIAKKI